MIDVAGALDYGCNHLSEVEGWLSPLDFAVITSLLVAQDQLSVEGDIAEIGVWRGKSAILLSFFADPSDTLFAIDVFDLYYPDGPPASVKLPYADPDLFRQNIQKYGRPTVVQEVPSDTRRDDTLANRLAGRCVRFFHIDGGHAFEHVAADLSIAMHAIGTDAIIVLDDFLQVDNPAVSEAIFSILRDPATDLVPFAVTAKKLYLARGGVRDYSRYLTALLPNAISRKRPLLGAMPLILNPARFNVERDFNSQLLQSVGQPVFDGLVSEQSARFPRASEWLDGSASMNA